MITTKRLTRREYYLAAALCTLAATICFAALIIDPSDSAKWFTDGLFGAGAVYFFRLGRNAGENNS